MSASTLFGSSRSGMGLLVDVVRQVLIAGAAVAAIAAISGCSHASQSGAMPSALSAPPQPVLIEQPPQKAAGDTFASPREARSARQAEVVSTLNEALAPPPIPAPAMKGSGALQVAEKAVAPLADTLAAIDSAQRVVVENLRNAETTGFKSSRTACGEGRDIASQIDVAQGELQTTQRALDVAIQGDGFFQVHIYTPEHPDGAMGYTRNGRLYVAKDGHVVVGQGDGYQLSPPMQVPVGTTSVTIEQDGGIKAMQAGSDKTTPQVIGRLTLVRFTDPTALNALGGGIYAASETSGQGVESLPTERGAGAIIQGSLEASNVDLIHERMRLRFLQGWRATILAALDGETSAMSRSKEAHIPQAKHTPANPVAAGN